MAKMKNFSDVATLSKERLSALAEHITSEYGESGSNTQVRVIDVEVGKVQPNPFQPRKVYDADALNDLASSIQQHGILQPLVGRQEADGTVTLIAGHRRWMASQQAGFATVPMVMRNQATDSDLQLIAIVENLQREDLHAVEKVRALASVAARFQNQEQASVALGMKRSALSNWLRVGELGDKVLDVCVGIPGCSLRTLSGLLTLAPARRLSAARMLAAKATQTGNAPVRETPPSDDFKFVFRHPQKHVSLVVSVASSARKTVITNEDYQAALKEALAKVDAEIANALAAS